MLPLVVVVVVVGVVVVVDDYDVVALAALVSPLKFGQTVAKSWSTHIKQQPDKAHMWTSQEG